MEGEWGYLVIKDDIAQLYQEGVGICYKEVCGVMEIGLVAQKEIHYFFNQFLNIWKYITMILL